MNEETRLEAAAETEEWDTNPGELAPAETDSETADTEAEKSDPPQADANPQEPEAEGADSPEAKTEDDGETDQFTLKHLDEVKTVSRDALITYAQKGLDYDRIRRKLDELSAEQKALLAFSTNPKETLALLSELAGQQGHPNIDAFVDETRAAALAEKEGIDPAVARRRIALERREKALFEKETRLNMRDGAAAAEAVAKEKQESDFAEFIGEYPELKPNSVPKEVWEIYGQGGRTLVQAYEKHEYTRLKALLAAEKKNAENKQRSTGSATTAGKASPTDELDRLWDSD